MERWGRRYWWGKEGDINGVVGDLKVSKETWFGDKTWYRHGIQWMPIGPDSKFMLSDDGGFVKEEWKR